MEIFLGIESRDAYTILVVATITLIAIVSRYFKLVAHPSKRLPPGSFGFPVIGESISFVRAYRHNKIGEWIQDHIGEYGPTFKTSLFGRKIIFLTGQVGNKFTLSSNSSNGIVANHPPHVVKLLGKSSLFVLSGSKRQILRSMLTSRLDPVNLRKYVSQADSIVKQQIFQELNNKDSIKMAPLVKKIAFNVSCSLLFDVSEQKEKDALYEDFTLFIKGVSSFPINLPGTTFHNALQARGRLCKKLSDILRRRREDVENGKQPGHNENIILCFLNLRDENGDHFTEEAIQDNLFSMIFASFDTLSSLLCHFIRKLAISSEVYDKVLEEQKEVLKARKEYEKLSWSEIQMMKYTWTVAQELLRLSPPVPISFRFTARDTAFSSFDIPKGWQIGWAATPTHMDKSIFEDPKHFDPKRFESQSKSSIPPYTYVPFGAGLRICPGAEYARFVVLLIVHHLVTNYSWTEMVSDEPIICIPNPYPTMGLPVKLHATQVNLD